MSAEHAAEKDAHGMTCDGCLMLGFVTRLEQAEARIHVLTQALHLSTVPPGSTEVHP